MGKKLTQGRPEGLAMIKRIFMHETNLTGIYFCENSKHIPQLGFKRIKPKRNFHSTFWGRKLQGTFTLFRIHPKFHNKLLHFNAEEIWEDVSYFQLKSF